MSNLQRQNERERERALIDSQPYQRAYIEYQRVCPYCEGLLKIGEKRRWPWYECKCSFWLFDFHNKYKREPFAQEGNDVAT